MANPLPILQALASAFYKPQLQAVGVDKNGNYVDASGKPTSLYQQPGWFQRSVNPEARQVQAMNLAASSQGLEAQHNRALQRELAGEDVSTLPVTSQAYPKDPEAEITEYMNGVRTPSQAFGELNSIDKINAGVPELATQEELSRIAANTAVNRQTEQNANIISPLARTHEQNVLGGEISSDPYINMGNLNEAKLREGLDTANLGTLGTQQDTLRKNVAKANLEASQIAPTPYIMDTVDSNGVISSPHPVATGAPSMALSAMNMGMDPVTHKIIPWVPRNSPAFVAAGMGYEPDSTEPSDMYGVPGIRKITPTPAAKLSTAAPMSTPGVVPSLAHAYMNSVRNAPSNFSEDAEALGNLFNAGMAHVGNAMKTITGGTYQSSPSEPTTPADVAHYKLVRGIPLTAEDQAALQ